MRKMREIRLSPEMPAGSVGASGLDRGDQDLYFPWWLVEVGDFQLTQAAALSGFRFPIGQFHDLFRFQKHSAIASAKLTVHKKAFQRDHSPGSLVTTRGAEFTTTGFSGDVIASSLPETFSSRLVFTGVPLSFV